MYLVNESSKLEPVNRVYKIREKSQSLLDHPRNNNKSNYCGYFFRSSNSVLKFVLPQNVCSVSFRCL